MLRLCCFTIATILLLSGRPLPSQIHRPKTPVNETARYKVYLTFDDGPLEGSEHIDSVILAEKLKISVFLVGEHVQANRTMENYFKYYGENPYIDEYNHSFTHAHDHYEAFYRDPATVVADINKNQQLLRLPYKIVRLPGRNMWRIGNRSRDDIQSGSSSATALAKNGYEVIGWDLEWQHDATGKPVQTAEKMAAQIGEMLHSGKTFTPGHIVILLHDEMFRTQWEETELKKMIDLLRKEPDYDFEQIRFYPRQ
jgi:peptidoglycan/xylan/chitin deacetylase (PgdA/CDA1 family)